MKRAKSKTNEPKIRLIGWNAPVGAAAAAIASLAAGGVQAAPGDLDPSFGDVGRQSNLGIINELGQEALWSADGADDDSVLFGGGDLTCPFGCYEYYFTGKLTPTGMPSADFARAPLSISAAYDTALQADGKLVGVGILEDGSNRSSLVLVRQRIDGSLDPEFGSAGIVRVSDGTTSYSGHALTVEANGRLTVAGYRDNRLLVARFLSNGTPDPAFGSNGVYVATDAVVQSGSQLRIGAVQSGGYRVLANIGAAAAPCVVAGLTQSGSPDTNFGGGTGATQVRTMAGERVFCSSMVVLADGRVVVVGSTEDGQARATRLLANGAKDASFDADAALRIYRNATAIALDAAGKFFVATDSDDSGVHVTRLSADGALDATYGTAGTATIDLFAPRTLFPRVTDLKALSGDRVLVAGQTTGPAFIARLLGNAPGGGPGVLSVKSSSVVATEQQGQAVVTVRRTGGSKGAVAVSYGTEAAPNLVAASPGQDFTPTSGRLEWADGEAGERRIVVPIANDTEVEPPEFFAVSLSSPEGGAGLGTTGADVEIAGAGYPAGHIRLQALQQTTAEGLLAQFIVTRDSYALGIVSVTLRVSSESTATAGEDFASPGLAKGWQDVVLTWDDGDFGEKIVLINVIKDDRVEPAETLVLELVSPTGGAVLAPESKATVYTLAESPPPIGGSSGGGSGGGGGSFGWLGAMLLGLWGACRRRRST